MYQICYFMFYELLNVIFLQRLEFVKYRKNFYKFYYFIKKGWEEIFILQILVFIRKSFINVGVFLIVVFMYFRVIDG